VNHPARLRSEEANDRVRSRSGNGGGRPPFSLPNSPLRTASPTLVRSARETPGKRTIAPRVRREAIDGWRCSNDESRRTRSGSRPKIMVARFVTPDRGLPCRPFVSSEVRSDVRDRRLEWPPVRRVLRELNLTTRLASGTWASGPVTASSKVGGTRATGGDLGTGAPRHRAEGVREGREMATPIRATRHVRWDRSWPPRRCVGRSAKVPAGRRRDKPASIGR
jgi:hypothetical protein